MRLPVGYAARLRPDVVRRGPVLLGGSPFRALRLSTAALAALDGDRVVVRDAVTAAVAARLLDGNLAEPELDALPRAAAAELTVVVPVRDRADQLDRCLEALAGLAVVVVDDGSDDPAAVAAIAARHGAELLAFPVNRGPAAARNAGLGAVRTAYVAFVDCDVLVSADALRDLARHFADPEVSLVAPRVRGRAVRGRWFERYDAAVSSLDLGPTSSRVTAGASVAWLPAACLLGRVAALGEGFAEALRAGEDVDLVWRLDEAGRVVRYDATVEVAHEVRTSLRGWLGRKVVYGSSGALLAARHGDRTAPAVLGPVTTVGAASVLLARPLGLPVAPVALGISWRTLRRALPPELGATRALRVALVGLGWGVRQEAALLVRHWWPLAALLAPWSRSLRRALVVAVVVDSAVAVREHRDLDVPTLLLGRRLDDAAYGAGLWLGALRARSVRCLLPRRPG